MPFGRTKQRLCTAGLLLLALAGCGHDSYITESPGIQTTVEFGEGIEVLAPTDTLIRRFDDFSTTTYNGRPAILLRHLIGDDLVASPDLYGYRLYGTDGFYANMPGREYGDNTWAQLGYGYLDLVDFRVVFEKDQDAMLRNGHNVKWLIRAELFRSIDIAWSEGHKLAPVSEVATTTIPEGYEGAGTSGLMLSTIVSTTVPTDVNPMLYTYRVLASGGASLPRPLNWEEMGEAYYLLESDRIVMRAELGSAYQVAAPQTIRLEGSGS